ncbi:predicted GPI-anchored protein 58 [Onychostruthus taczanowskii]|uniref:predicted GPI-anchored protein 58 n=1 Tax=Onychostruthus taczanowskii TaxID=356909 RepID=UPI001B805B1B|nr:predicted GPI-anchored protein 58 [Onychostruthus taczanowskii]
MAAFTKPRGSDRPRYRTAAPLPPASWPAPGTAEPGSRRATGRPGRGHGRPELPSPPPCSWSVDPPHWPRALSPQPAPRRRCPRPSRLSLTAAPLRPRRPFAAPPSCHIPHLSASRTFFSSPPLPATPTVHLHIRSFAPVSSAPPSPSQIPPRCLHVPATVLKPFSSQLIQDAASFQTLPASMSIVAKPVLTLRAA